MKMNYVNYMSHVNYINFPNCEPYMINNEDNELDHMDGNFLF